MNTKFFTAKNVAVLGILIALVIVLQLFASAIPMFGITVNFSLIPIALAGIMLGWLGGAIVGFTCGLVIFITMAVLGQEPSTAYLFQNSPVILTFTCIGKSTVAGLVSGLVFKLLAKRNLFIATCVSSVIIPIINTGLYIVGILLMKEHAATFMGIENSASIVFTVLFTIIWLNFVIEMAINIIFVPLIYRVIQISERKFSSSKKTKNSIDIKESKTATETKTVFDEIKEELDEGDNE